MRIDGQFRKNLSLLNLSDYELRVFASACELGLGSAASLAKRARIPRPSVYPVLDTLIEKGLVSVEKRKGANIFLPSSPDALVVLAEERLADARAGLEASKKVAEALRSSKGRDALTSAKILIFEGKKVIEQMLYDFDEEWRRSIIERGRAWVGFQDSSFLKHYGDWVVDYWKEYQYAKDWKKDLLRLFSAEDTDTKKVAKEAAPLAGSRRQLRPLPKGIPFSASVWVNGDYVVLLKTRADPHYALQIRDEILAENLYVFFNFVWEL